MFVYNIDGTIIEHPGGLIPLESRIHTMQMEGKIFRVHIPMEDVMEIKGGKKQVVQRKVFQIDLCLRQINRHGFASCSQLVSCSGGVPAVAPPG